MNSQTARERILARLYASGSEQTDVPDVDLPRPVTLDSEKKVSRLASMLEAMRTEVHVVPADRWVENTQGYRARQGLEANALRTGFGHRTGHRNGME